MTPDDAGARAVRLVWLVGALMLMACGPRGGPPPKTPAKGEAAKAGPVEPPRPQAPPEPALEVKAVHAFQAKERCSQGPLEIEVEALGADREERVVIVACGPRSIAGRYTLATRWYQQMGTFGPEHPENARCVAGPGEGGTVEKVAPAAAPPAAASPPQHRRTKAPRGRARKGKRSRQVAPPPPAPTVTSVPWDASRKCRRLQTIATSRWSRETGVPLPRGTPVKLRIWSPVPNDLEGVVIVVKQLALAPSVTAAQWAEHQRRSAEYTRELRAWIDRLPTCGTPAAAHVTCARRAPASARAPGAAKALLAPSGAAAGPPPPPRPEKRPPSPSANAVWVPGYWVWGDGAWGWLAGWWRVPKSDVAKQLTVRAPAPPPAPKVERPAPRPTARAVWVPGHWMWAAAGWVWVEGAWRVPPHVGARWLPPEWRTVPSGVVFIPGQWID